MARKGTSGVFVHAQAYRQRVRLPAVQAANLAGKELAFAIAYELEPFSGVPAREAAVEWEELEDGDAAMLSFDAAVVHAKYFKSGRTAIQAKLPHFAVAAFVLLALAVAADFAILSRRESSLAKEFSERSALDAELSRLKSQIAATRAEAERVAAERAAKEEAGARADALRSFHRDILASVARAAGSRAVVRKITPEGGLSSLFEATAVSAGEASAVLAAAAKEAAAKGWVFSPGTIETKSGGMTAGFSFSISAGGEE